MIEEEPECPKANRDCGGCGRFMVSQRRWWAYSAEERQEMLQDGLVCHGAGDLCKACQKQAYRDAKKAEREKQSVG